MSIRPRPSRWTRSRPEEEPLKLFGRAAVDAVTELLEQRDVAVHTRAYPAEFRDGELRLVPNGGIAADRVVALPRLQGQTIDGVPQTAGRFVPVDAHGRVHGLVDVFAAGNITAFPVKQGGMAAQQAEAAAETIAAGAGVELTPRPFRPVLRGLLLTGTRPRYLRTEIGGGSGETSSASQEALWWPPAKIVGRYLAPFLGERAGFELPGEVLSGAGGVPVEVELGTGDFDHLTTHRFDLAVGTAGPAERDEGGGPWRVGEVMSAEPLVVAPEDTLGEVAERMRERDVASALVADYGRLIGILTARDLLRAFAGRVHSSGARVREWMTADPVSVSAGTTLPAAALVMSQYGVHHLPVVDGDRPVGMVGMRDVVRPGVLASPSSGIGLR